MVMMDFFIGYITVFKEPGHWARCRRALRRGLKGIFFAAQEMVRYLRTTNCRGKIVTKSNRRIRYECHQQRRVEKIQFTRPCASNTGGMRIGREWNGSLDADYRARRGNACASSRL